MFTMFILISSENKGLFSLTSFISLIKARVRAFTSKVSDSSSSRYSTAAAIGAFKCKVFLIRNLFTVEIKILIPPSGRLTFLIIRAAVPTRYKLFTEGVSASFLSITIPM